MPLWKLRKWEGGEGEEEEAEEEEEEEIRGSWIGDGRMGEIYYYAAKYENCSFCVIKQILNIYGEENMFTLS